MIFSISLVGEVCRKWNVLGSDDVLWANLFKGRWGEERAEFYSPVAVDSKSWKEIYETQDRCDRLGLGLKIVREGVDYYLIHGGEIQRHLGSRRQRKVKDEEASSRAGSADVDGPKDGTSSYGILDKMLFFIGDLEVATVEAKRSRII